MPIASISVPTENGPLVLTFLPKLADEPKAPAAADKNAATKGEPPKRPRSDVAGAFTPIPAGN